VIGLLDDRSYSSTANDSAVSNLTTEIETIKNSIRTLNTISNTDLNELDAYLSCIDLDRIVQGSINRYIVDNIYNGSLVINGTLTVREVQIIDTNDEYYSNLYSCNLYENSNCKHHNSNHIPNYTNYSNIVYGILENSPVVMSITSNIIISEINPNILQLKDEINDIKDMLLTIANLDNIEQGTSNKYITNNIYDDSLLVNGTLTSLNVDIVEIERLSVISESYQYDNVVTNNEKIEQLQLEVQTQADEISLLKNKIDDLTILINSMI
jgi:hypothetical protein